MITSETALCNIALDHLGEAPIVSMNDDRLAASACLRHYAECRDKVLRSHRWNFATKRVALSRLAARPAFGWSYQYELPADFMRATEVNGSEAGDVVSGEWLIEGRAILTNEEAVNLVYVRRVTDVSLFDSLFVDALAVKLAIALSETLRGSTGKTESLVQLYERITAPLARRIDANEGRRRKGLLPVNSHALRARGGNGGMS